MINALPFRITSALFLFAFICFQTNAQDIITLKSGEEMSTQVIRVLEGQVEYKDYKTADEEIYILQKSDIFMIEYADGKKDIFSIDVVQDLGKYLSIHFNYFGIEYYQGPIQIGKKDFEKQLKPSWQIYKEYKSGRGLNIAGNVLGIPTGFIFGYQIGKWIGSGFDDGINGTVLVLSGLAWFGSIALTHSGKMKMKKAVQRFNKDEAMGFKLSISQNGMGLALVF